MSDFRDPYEAAHWDLVPGRTALVHIDLQNDFLHADGWYATSGIDIAHMQRVIEPAKRLSRAWRASAASPSSGRATAPAASRTAGRSCSSARSCATAACASGRGATRSSTSSSPAATTGSSRRTGSPRSSTRTWSSCCARLHADTVLVTGVLTNQCVAATSKDAMFRDFKPIVVADATGTTLPHLHEPALEMIRVGWGEVRSLDDALAELAGLRVKLGAHFLPEDFPTFVASVQAAERAGYARAWLVDGQMLWHDVYVYMAHALAATERIEVGTGVTNPLTRHPSVTASAHATLAQLHPGRVLLGIGRGDNAVRTLGLKPVPTAELAATVPLLRAWMAGEEAGGTRIRWANEQRADHDLRDGAEEPAPRRRAGRHRDDLRRRQRRGRALGDRARARRRRGGGPRSGRGRDRRALRDARLRRPGGGLGGVPLGARRVREPHRVRAEVESRPRDAGGDDAGSSPRATRTTTTTATSTRRPRTRAT